MLAIRANHLFDGERFWPGPATVLTKFQDIASAGEQIVATNVPTSELGTLLDLAAKGKSQPMGSVSFTPPLIVPMAPDFAKIRRVVADRIAASEQAATASASPSASTAPTAAPSVGVNTPP